MIEQAKEQEMMERRPSYNLAAWIMTDGRFDELPAKAVRELLERVEAEFTPTSAVAGLVEALRRIKDRTHTGPAGIWKLADEALAALQPKGAEDE